ncbi:MAG: STAS domain-containing protein [Solirubrobacteraceae bacterium]
MPESDVALEQLTIERTVDGNRLVLSLAGELDLATAPALKAVLEDAQSDGLSHLVIDLSGVQFMDSTGITVLAAAQRAADENQHSLSLRRGSAQVQRVLKITGLLERLTFED